MKVSTTGYKANSKDKNEKQLFIKGADLTMTNVPHKVKAQPVYPNGSYGIPTVMLPGVPHYSFPGAIGVIEEKLPQAQIGLPRKKKKNPIFTSDPNNLRLKQYSDSLDVYNLSNQVQRIYPNLPQITKDKYDEIEAKENALTHWDIDEVKYKEDKKNKKKNINLEDYVYSTRQDAYDDPRRVANMAEFDSKWSTDPESIEKFIITLPNGDMKIPSNLWEGKPDWDNYTLVDAKTGASRWYSKDYYNGKYKLHGVNPIGNEPIETRYYGKDAPVKAGSVNFKSKEFKNKKLTKAQEKQWQNYIYETEQRDFYEEPTQPVIYKRGYKGPEPTEAVKQNVTELKQTVIPYKANSDRRTYPVVSSGDEALDNLNQQLFGNMGLLTDNSYIPFNDPKYNPYIGGIGPKVPEMRTTQFKFNNGGELPQAQLGLMDTIFKRRVLNQYPVMKNVYGNKGENLNIIRDRNFDASSHGFGDIEFIHPGSGTVNYTDDYTYQSPTPDKYTAVYNPKGAARGDVFLDMLHGMRNDPGYMDLLQNFGNAVKDARGKDMQYYYEQDLANNLIDADRESYDNNYIDGLLRAHLYPYTPGKTIGRKDYDIEKQVSSPEMYSTAMDIYNYLRAKPKTVGEKQQGGELPKAQKGEEWLNLGYENKVYTYKDDPEFFDSHARFSDNPRYNDWIRNTVYSGKWGYNPVTGESVRLNANQQVNVSPETKTLAKDVRTWTKEEKAAHPASTIKNLPRTEIEQLRKEDAGFDQYATTAEKEAGKRTAAAQSKAMVNNLAFYAPGAAFLGVETLPAIWGAELLGTGLTVGNIANPIFFGQGIKNTLDPESDMRKSWSKAYNNPSKSNLIDATLETGLNSLNFLGAGSVGSDLNKMGNFVGRQVNAVRNDIDIIRNAGKYARDMQWQTADDVFNLQGSKQLGSKQLALPGSPNTFKSEIDWSKWNKQIPNNSELINEYNTIEQTSKANGTWMKNPDGSAFQGTPEQFVQQNSQNFKKAYPKGFDKFNRGYYRNEFEYFAKQFPEGRSFFGGDPDIALYYAPSDVKNIVTANTDQKGLFELYYPHSPEGLHFNAEGNSWREIGVDPSLGIENTWNGAKGEFRPGVFRDPSTGKLVKGQKVSTNDIATHLEKNNLPYAKISNVFDGKPAEYVTIVNNKPGNYLKSFWGNNGMFDLSNPNIYEHQIRGLVGPNTSTGLTEENVADVINRQKEWLKSEEYVKRRSANTGETPQEVRQAVDKTLRAAENARFNLNSNITAQGKMTPQTFLQRFPKVEIAKHTYNPMNTLEHEVSHLYSPVIFNMSDAALHKGLFDPNVANLSASERGLYANYPRLGTDYDKTAASIDFDAPENYLKTGPEQQVRHLGVRNDILKANNLPIDAQLTEAEIKPFIDSWAQRINKRSKDPENLDNIKAEMDYDEIWLEEAYKIRENLLKEYGVKSDLDLTPAQAKEYVQRTKDQLAKNVTDVLNKAWIAVPAAIGVGAATQQKKKGGNVNKRNNKALDDYFTQAWASSRKSS